MKMALIAAVTAAVVAAGTAGATSWINGRSIRPHSIPANRLTDKARASLHGQQGPTGAQGPAGPRGSQGPQGVPGDNGYGIERSRLATKEECPAGGMAVLFDWPFIPPYAHYGESDSFYWHICNGEQGPQGPQGPKGEPGSPGLGNATLTICLDGRGGITQAPCAGSAQPVQVVIVSSS